MGWFSKLTGQDKNPYAADLLLKHPARVTKPKVRGLTPDQRAAVEAAWRQQHQEAHFRSFRIVRARAVEIGATHYEWRSCGGDSCARCRSLHGRRFKFSMPPPGGHPGESHACDLGWCRCYARPILPDNF